MAHILGRTTREEVMLILTNPWSIVASITLSYKNYEHTLTRLYFERILQELMRPKEKDSMGQHWSINVFDHLCGIALAWATRINGNGWKWRDFVLDRTLLFAITELDCAVMRDIVRVWWWSCHQLYIRTNPAVLDQMSFAVMMTTIYTGSSPMLRRLMILRWWFRMIGQFSNPDPPEYKYKSFESPEDIRLVLLYPRLGFRSICCSLIQGPHMQLLHYEAVSYNWGSMDLTEEILVDGQKKKVTASVYEILSSHSSLLLPKLLWIDALCIDQSNDKEKSQQVPMMNQIYQNCISAVVFLGKSPLLNGGDVNAQSPLPYRYDDIAPLSPAVQSSCYDARLAIDLLNELDILGDGALRSLATYQLYDVLRPFDPQRRKWNALLTLLQHPWFERIWVIQEVALPSKVQIRYVNEIIPWDVLARGVEKLHKSRSFLLWLERKYGAHYRNIQNTSLYNIIRMDRFRRGLQQTLGNDDWGDYRLKWQPTLPKLLSENTFFKATNPRDLIYGLMSLCTKPMKVDYSSSIPDVYTQAAINLIEEKAYGAVFHAAGIGNRCQDGVIASKLPSWVPDWTQIPKVGKLDEEDSWGAQLRQVKAMLHKGQKEEKIDIVLSQSLTLDVLGNPLDTIEELSDDILVMEDSSTRSAIDEMHQLWAIFQAYRDLVRNSRHVSDPYLGGDQRLSEAFRRTLFLDRKLSMWEEGDLNIHTRFLHWEQALSSTFQATDLSQGNRDGLYQVVENVDKVTELVKAACGGRRFFISSKGFMGLCPPFTKKTDMIFFVQGLHSPLLLRQHSIGTVSRLGFARRCLLVGECYVHRPEGWQQHLGSYKEEHIEIL